MNYKATFIGSYNNPDGYTRDLFYTYRGHEYMITDYGWKGYSESLAEQHKKEQDRIDEIIDEKDKKKNSSTSEEEFTLDDLFALWEE
jgi:hypothetical protein